MFKFLKDKLKKAISIFSKKVKKEAEIKEIPEEEVKEEIKEELRKEEEKEELEAKEEEELVEEDEPEETPKEEPEEEPELEEEEKKAEEELKKEEKELEEDVLELAEIEEPSKEEIEEEKEEEIEEEARELEKEIPELEKVEEEEPEEEPKEPEPEPEPIHIPKPKKKPKKIPKAPKLEEKEPKKEIPEIKEEVKEEKEELEEAEEVKEEEKVPEPEPKEEKKQEPEPVEKPKKKKGLFSKLFKKKEKPKPTLKPEVEPEEEIPEPIPEPEPEPVEEKPKPKPKKKKVPEPEPIPEPPKPVEKRPEPERVPEAPKPKIGLFKRIKERFTTIRISEEKFEKLFWELEVVLLENNVAVEVIDKIKADLKADLTTGKVSRKGVYELIEDSLRKSIQGLFMDQSFNLLKEIKKKKEKPYVISFIGVNGSGKTTTMAKVAHMLQKNNLSVVFAASDTFRAAAIQQLEEHANKLGVKMIKQDYESDPAAVAFDAIKHAKAKGIDVVLIDTAGRLHSNDNLMNELKKLIRVNTPDINIFVGESITGNDCVEQAKLFNEAVGIDAIILAKADVDEKGGAAVSVSYVTKKPILYFGTGQTYDDLTEFKPQLVIKNIGL